MQDVKAKARIIRVSEQPALFSKAERFVSKYEAFSCALMQKLCQKSDDVFIILSGQKHIEGVFSFIPSGTVLPCLPEDSRKVRACLKDFFFGKDIWCLSGAKQFVSILKAALMAPLEKSSYKILETRECVLLKSQANLAPTPAPFGADIVQCNVSHAKLLMPLHTAYFKAEVLPYGFSQTEAASFLILERALRTKSVYAVHIVENKKDIFVSKAHISARGKRYLQLGGVYTIPQFRGKGFAKFLLSSLLLENKNAVLYVRKENNAAFALYKKLGFVPFGEYEITYFSFS